MIALSLVAFLGSVAVASAVSTNEIIKTEISDTDKDKDKKKKKCSDDCAKEFCTKEGEKATSKKSCTKGKSACCSKKKAETKTAATPEKK